MDRAPASSKTFEKCPECEYRLPNHSYSCSIRKRIGRRDFLKKAGAIGALAGVGGAGFFLGQANAIPAPTLPSVVEPGSLNVPAKVEIYFDSNSWMVRNGDDGSQTKFSVLSSAWTQALSILTVGRSWKEKIVIKTNGNQTLDTTLLIPSFTIVEIQGKLTGPGPTSGWVDMFRNTSFPNGDTDIDIIGGVLDGNRGTDNTAASLVSGVQFGDQTGTPCKRIRILYLQSQNQHGEGISFDNCQDSLIEGCYCTNNGDDGISVEEGSIDCVIRDNVCSLQNNPLSPIVYGSGIEFDDGGNRLVIEGNICYSNKRGIGGHVHAAANAPNDVVIRGNICRNNDYYGIGTEDLNTGIHLVGCTIQNNLILNNNTTNPGASSGMGSGIWVKLADDYTITGNQIHDNGTAGIADHPGVKLDSCTRFIVSENRIKNTQWIGVHILNCTDSVIIGNFLYQNAGNPVINHLQVEGASSGDSTIALNRIRSSVGTNGIRIVSGTTGTHLVIGNNVKNTNNLVTISAGVLAQLEKTLGYQPIGKITNFVDGTNFAPWGTASAVVASTDYVVNGTDIFITSTGGTGVSITVKDPSGNTIQSGLATLSQLWLPIGFKVNFGAFSVAPTVTVWAN